MTTVVKQGTEIMFSEYGLHRIEANYMPRTTRGARASLSVAVSYARASPRPISKSTAEWEDHVLTSLTNCDYGRATRR